MKIAITALAGDLKAEIDPRFGRCAYFILMDPETMEWEAVANRAASAASGAGIQAAQFIIDRGVEAVITGNVGPNAHRTLNTAGIVIYTGAAGTVEETLKRYRDGELTEASSPTVPGHFGGRGVGWGGGRGGGRR